MIDVTTELNYWMMNTGRRSGDPLKVVSYYCSMLLEAGAPLWRVNIAQRFANPLLRAWGVIWTPGGTETYDVTLLTDSYVGSPFEYIMENQRALHKHTTPKTPYLLRNPSERRQGRQSIDVHPTSPLGQPA